MPITVRYPGDIRAMGRTAQLTGEGAFRTLRLNPLATSDENRRVSTQLSLLDLVEGARQSNLRASVSRMNTMSQIQAAQGQQRFSRESNERMAQFQSLDAMQRLRATGGLNAQAASAAFERRQQLGQDQFGYNQQLGEDRFGYSQELQGQQDFALDQRQQAQFRQAELSGIMQTLDPQAQGQIRTIQFQKQKAIDDQRKRPVYRPDEFQNQILPVFDQRINEVIQTAQQQPSLPQLFEQEIQWIPDRQTGVDVPWIRDKNAQWRIPQGWKAPDIEIESSNVADFYSTPDGQKKILDLATKDWASQKEGVYVEGELVPGRSFPDILSQYQRELRGQQFPQGNTPYASGFTGHLGGAGGAPASQPPAPPVQQAAPQQPAPWSIQGLQQLRELITSGQVDTSSVPGGPNVHKTATALHSIDGIIKLQTKYPSYDAVPRDEKTQWIEWRINLRGLVQ